MQVIPTVDISRGTCVRRKQGDSREEIVYPKTPMEYALQWEEAGAERLHVVDLDAADDTGDNFSLVEEIVRKTSAQVEVGGGIRSLESVKRYWDLGVSRVIMGTAAIENEDLICKAVGMIGEALVVDVASRDGLVRTHGWVRPTQTRAVDLLMRLHLNGVRRIIYTDTARDGMLEGPNFAELKKICEVAQNLTHQIKITGSGGASCIDDLVRADSLGVDEYIVGEALYKNRLTLGEIRAQFG